MTLREIVKEWRRGCSNTTPENVGPWRCRPCTAAFLRAATKRVFRVRVRRLIRARGPHWTPDYDRWAETWVRHKTARPAVLSLLGDR